MEEETVQPQGAEGNARPPQAPAGGGISRARKIRLTVLICILLVLAVITVLYNVKLNRQEKARVQALATALAELRTVIKGLDPRLPGEVLGTSFVQADLLYRRIQELDTQNRDAERLAIALCYARGQFDQALERFNSLPVKEIAAEIDGAVRRKAAHALDPFQALAADLAGAEIHEDGKQFLRQCGFLWGLARSITEGAVGERDKALLLCRWMALHMLPEEGDTVPADPYLAAWRSHGSAAELAWAYAELARQAGVRCKVAALPPVESQDEWQHLVQVYPGDAEPFLVNPFLGIPFLNPASGELLSLESLAGDAEPYDALLGLAGGASGYKAEHFRAAELRTALHPYACFPRFMVFDHLLSGLPERPQVAFDFGMLPGDEGLELWERPVEVLGQMQTRRYRELLAGANRALDVVRQPRLLHLQGHYQGAGALYDAVTESLAKALAEAEVEEGAALLRETMEQAALFSAMNAYDSGRWQDAEEQLRQYLDDYPTGRWQTVARPLLAETLSQSGAEAADALWRDLPEARRLYGALRLKGLLPMATVPGTAVSGGPSAGSDRGTPAESR